MLHSLLKLRLGIGPLLFLAALWLAHSGSPLAAKSIFDDDNPPATGTKPTQQPPVPPPPAPPQIPQPQTQPATPPPAPTTAATSQPQTQPAPAPLPLVQRALYQLPQPIPPDMEIALAQRALAERFPSPTSKPTAGEQLASAASLMDAAAAAEELGVRFLILKRARDTFLAAGDPAGAMDAVREMAWNFDVDAYGLSFSVLETASRIELSPPQAREAAKAGLHCALLALEDEQYEWAGKLAAITDVLARRARDPGMLTLTHQFVRQLDGLQEECPHVRDAQQRLGKAPSDPADNLLVGRFLCLTCRQWARGLPLLAKGSDPALGDLARREMKPPIDGSGQSDLADAWFAVGRSMWPGRDRDSVLGRAAEWYEAAENQLEGSARQTAAKRAAAAWSEQMQHGLIAEIYSGKNLFYRRLTRLDQNIDWSWPTAGPEPGMGHLDFSIVWRGYLAPPQSGAYRIVAKADDSMRVWVNGKQLIDAKANSTLEARSALVTLGIDPAELRVEYHQAKGAALAGLGWIPPKERVIRAIPTSALLRPPLELAEVFPPPLAPDASGAVSLDGGTAQLHGHTIHLSDYGSGLGLEAWKKVEEFPSWHFTAPAGDYDVQITYACADQFDGATYTLCINGAKLANTVAVTGGWDKPASSAAGKVHLLGGNVTLALKPDSAPHDYVMFLERIVLAPVR